ncbi:hypothetical protein CDAR_290791 [Caerostris darwini]|uniref:Uncharacterized protein n=1 Tax=Caerostris darwini TaxID=1538125 RepID=A0AAV4VNA7_9ARAC|nr:hypothetical protein CDAR_290791 [Caerostris darwini]
MQLLSNSCNHGCLCWQPGTKDSASYSVLQYAYEIELYVVKSVRICIASFEFSSDNLNIHLRVRLRGRETPVRDSILRANKSSWLF